MMNSPRILTLKKNITASGKEARDIMAHKETSSAAAIKFILTAMETWSVAKASSGLKSEGATGTLKSQKISASNIVIS